MKKEKQEFTEVLTRGVDEIIEEESLIRRLKSGKELRIKLGIDPTSPNLHLGRSIPLLKLRDFQQLGHKVVFIIGDFTGVIGDTSDKESERPMLSEEVVQENLKTYIKQASNIIDIEKAEINHNSNWLSKLGYSEIGKQANAFSLNSFISRENIKKRLDKGSRVSLRELLYPLMQGYDSVQITADVELGGTDQRFNMLAGRDLQRLYGQKPQDVITNPLVEGIDGRKMSSSYGNTVNLLDEPNDMFGKVMSINDDLIIKYFHLMTRIPLKEVAGYEEELKSGVNPRDIKLKLAFEIVRMYHSEEQSKKAQEYFIKTFTNKETPEETLEFRASNRNVLSILKESGLASSRSEAKRIVEQGGVKIDGNTVTDDRKEVPTGSVLQKGKRKFLRIK
ncbi:MAG: tyrosine--tRNA ligase [Candidatus Paceibacterota bacterium]